jgi:hypothetical protein
MSNSDETHLFQNMRSMISLIDKLRDFNLDDYISLPRIAVLGEQSAGKSSLLESIAGITFLPRGTGIVTRRPLELRMIRKTVDVPYFVFPKDYGDKQFTDPRQVTKIIEDLTDKSAGNSKNISEIPIICKIFSSQVPDLTLIDLPGITRNPVEDQPDNIEEITKGLVSLYCSNEDTLILCVIPANIDLSNSDALNFAKKLDPRGERTLGVLTKIDLMDDGTDATKVLKNEEIKLLHGYVGVKGRSQADIKNNTPMKEAIQREIDFFGKHPIYSTLPTELLGTLSLINRISKLLFSMIQKSLPKIQQEIGTRKKNVLQHLNNLGEEFPDEEERKLEIVFRLVRKFKEFFDQEVNGRYFHQKLVTKSDTRHERTTETITYKLNNLFDELYKEFTTKKFRIADAYTDEEIRHSIEVYQGDSIPGFQSFDSFLNLILPQLDKLKMPIASLLEEAKAILEERGLQLIDKIFKNFPVLNNEIKDSFTKLLNHRKKLTKDILNNLINCEENYLFSNDPLLLEKEPVEQKRRGARMEDVLVTELRNRINKYFFIVVRNLRDCVPKLLGQFLLKKFNNTLEVEILNALNNKNYCLDSMYENKKVKSERDQLKRELSSLNKAESLLVSDFGMGFSVITTTPSHNDKKTNHKKISFDEEDEGNALDQELLERFDQINEDFLKYNEDVLRSQNQKNIHHFHSMEESHSHRKIQTHSNLKTHQSSKIQEKPREIPHIDKKTKAPETHQNERVSNKNINNPKETPNMNQSNSDQRNSLKGNTHQDNNKGNTRNQKSPFSNRGKPIQGNIFNDPNTNKNNNNLFGNNLFGEKKKPDPTNQRTQPQQPNQPPNNTQKKYDGFLDFF